jgi:hypothetical protein
VVALSIFSLPLYVSRVPLFVSLPLSLPLRPTDCLATPLSLSSLSLSLFCRHAKYSDAEQRDLVVKYARALRHFGSRFLDGGGIGDDDDADPVGRGIGGVDGTGTGGGSSTSTSTGRSGSGGFAFALQHLLWTMKRTGPVLDALGPQQRLAVLRVCCVLLERLRAAPSYRAGVVVTGSNAATAAVALGWIQQVRVCVRVCECACVRRARVKCTHRAVAMVFWLRLFVVELAIVVVILLRWHRQWRRWDGTSRCCSRLHQRSYQSVV